MYLKADGMIMHIQKVVFLILLALSCRSFGSFPELQLSEELYNIDIDDETNIIFIGGKNVILKVSPTLKELKRITSGPLRDYIECLESKSKPVCPQEMTDNRNKILLIDSANKSSSLVDLLSMECVKEEVLKRCQWKFQIIMNMLCQILIYPQLL